MDARKSIEDQFSKLHPCLPVKTKIGIVGAGPSGLSAAYALSKLGYNNVTVLEKHHTVAGMCESVDIEGKMYDLGGQVIAANSAPTISQLVKEMGAEFEEMDSHKLAVIDSHTGNYQDMEVADDYISILSLTLKLQDEANKSKHIGIRAMSDIAPEPTLDFLKLHDLKAVPKSVAYGYTASGYGFVQDMPYAYIQEFIRTSMAGKIRRIKGGYTSMWHKLGKSLPFNVLCDTEVIKIQRSSAGASVTIKSANGDEQLMEFDKIILTGSLTFNNGRTYRSSSTSEVESNVVELNDLEKELFNKVQTVDYYTTVLKIKGFEHLHMGFYYFGEFMEDPATIGHPVAMQRFFADTDIFLFWSYGNSCDIRGPTVTKLVVDIVKTMGGVIEKVVLQRRFKYFPHVKSEDMKNHFFDKLESELQGYQSTYYVGGLMAFELTERNSSYSMAMICKHFATDNVPMFPYVKRLFPLICNHEQQCVRTLGELPGIQFPDLLSLDSYLKFWGTHSIIDKKILYTWINEEGQIVDRRTYGELHTNASCIAHNLLTSRKPIFKSADRVLLVYLPGLEFIDAFFGCLRARIIPVPVLPPDPFQRGGQALLKIENISKACKAVAILSTSSYHSAVRAGFVKNVITLAMNNPKSSAHWPDLPWIHTDTWVKNLKINSNGFISKDYLKLTAFISEPRPSDLCFLQFTSGSTGDAKGVMITHGGIIHNVKLMRKRYRSTSRTILVSWLPQYHDMGLIGGLFTALVTGGTAVLFSPMTFIRNPLLWLQTMSKYHATHSAGPNFAFELVLRRLEAGKGMTQAYDLSSMIFLMIAAEPVRQKTLKRFIEICRPFGLSQEVMAPGYGLAENCVFVSCAFSEGKPVFIDWQGRVCCGYIDSNDPDVEIMIVDPESFTELDGCGEEGEIWISSPSAGIGYWGNQELTQQTFYNKLEGHPGKKFTRTGDLGRIINGKLFITGRIKDLIIVAGRNIYPADVEKTVETSSELLRPGCCAVIGVQEEILSTKGISVPESSDQMGLVVIAEVREGKPINGEIVEKIKTRVAEEHGIAVASVKLIKPKTICKTTSGKIRRIECLKQFTEGKLSLATEPNSAKRFLFRSFSTSNSSEGKRLQPLPVQTPSSPQPHNSGKSIKEIVEFLKGIVSEQTGISIEKISSTESLVSYGIDSIRVVRAAQKLSDFLGVPVGAVDIFTATCISDLAIFSENLVMKSQPLSTKSPQYSLDDGTDFLLPVIEISRLQKLGFMFLQLLALIYASTIIILPAYLSSSMFANILSDTTIIEKTPPLHYLVSLFSTPLAWISYIFFTCFSLSLFGRSFLQLNYVMTPEISVWSINFVKWWALYKAQEIAGKILAVHLRGTEFLKHWFEMQGACIGASVLIDTVDITDPSLVSIEEGVVVGEGVLIQSHEVRNGILSFHPVKIGRNSCLGPYSVIQKGSLVGESVQILPLQKTEKGKPIFGSKKAFEVHKGDILTKMGDNLPKKLVPVYQFMGIYIVGFLGSLSAAIFYLLYIYLLGSSPSVQHFKFACIAGAFHWLPATIAAYAAIIGVVPSNPSTFALFVAIAYVSHGLILTLLTSIANHFLAGKRGSEQSYMRKWLRHRLNVACHLRFAKLLSGTEAFCMYLRLLGAKVGRHCSIRAINAITDPKLVSIGDGVHLGDFSRIVTGFYSSNGFVDGEIEVQKNSVVGSQSLVLSGSIIQEDVILGALSIAPVNSVLQRGGVYVGSQNPTMVKNTLHALDERIEEMDPKYKRIVGNLAGNLAITTMKVNSRYFHRIGVAGRGVLKMYNDLPGLPNHKIFRAGLQFPVLVRHSNSLSADDDARIDARGASVRILSDEAPILDLTLKTGKAFYARTIADFASWLVCGLQAREQQVEHAPHIGEAVWGSLRNTNSYVELHYYSNTCRLFRFDDGREMYVKFKLSPFDRHIGDDSGRVVPKGILPPETGAIPRDDNDTRPFLFLADDFRQRVDSPDGVRYIFQLQLRPVPSSEADREAALDCTRPWDENKFPYVDIGEITIDQNLTGEESEALQFNPFLRCREVDIIRATSSSQSASIDHGRSLVYEICQHLRNRRPIPATWRSFLEQSDAKVDLSGCPMAASVLKDRRDDEVITLTRTWYQTTWAAFFQPLLQTFVPYFVLGLVILEPIRWMLAFRGLPIHWLLPLFWVGSGILAALVCVVAKWVLVGRKREGEAVLMWSLGVFMDTVWQALRVVVGEYFMEMTSGSGLFVVWMRLMGSRVGWEEGVYVDSMGALLNPEMVEIERGGSVGRDALLFGHIYEGEGGKVKYGKVRICEGGSVGSRAVVMPGVKVEAGGRLSALSLAMKEEVVRSR